MFPTRPLLSGSHVTVEAYSFLLEKVYDQFRSSFDEVAQHSRRQQGCRLLDECFDQDGQDAGSQPIRRCSADGMAATQG